MNWYDTYTSARDEYAQRLAETEHAQLFVLPVEPNIRHAGTLRSRLGQTLILLGRWIDGHPETTARYEVEREGAR